MQGKGCKAKDARPHPSSDEDALCSQLGHADDLRIVWPPLEVVKVLANNRNVSFGAGKEQDASATRGIHHVHRLFNSGVGGVGGENAARFGTRQTAQKQDQNSKTAKQQNQTNKCRVHRTYLQGIESNSIWRGGHILVKELEPLQHCCKASFLPFSPQSTNKTRK